MSSACCRGARVHRWIVGEVGEHIASILLVTLIRSQCSAIDAVNTGARRRIEQSMVRDMYQAS